MRAKPEAGTELDQLIARYAMKGVEAPYSTNTDDAVQAWQKTAARERYAVAWALMPTWGYLDPTELVTLRVTGWRVVDQSPGADGQPSSRIVVEADTMALAICRAVWKLVRPPKM